MLQQKILYKVDISAHQKAGKFETLDFQHTYKLEKLHHNCMSTIAAIYSSGTFRQNHKIC